MDTKALRERKKKLRTKKACSLKLLQDDILLSKTALAQLQKLLSTDPAVPVQLRGSGKFLQFRLKFSTQHERMRTGNEIRKAGAKISKVKLQLVPQSLIQLTTCLCSRMYQLIPSMPRSE